MELLKNKTALITGAAQGIGLAISESFAEHGANVFMTDIQEELVQSEAARIAKAFGRQVTGWRMDVTQKEEVVAAIQVLVEQLGGLDILVNNAGMLKPYPFVEYPEEIWDKVFAINVKGTYLCSQAAAKLMIEQGRGGSILIISSASGKKPDMEGSAYCASKSAQIGLMRVLALELGKHGIRANAILPGATDTELLRNLFTQVQGLKELLESRTPLGKMALPRDQADAAVFLSSDLASHISGAQLVVSGGEFMED
jgi:NAD(P)-dependent dehydrogenase (short-subunit alcohol dehydrogenase family)